MSAQRRIDRLNKLRSELTPTNQMSPQASRALPLYGIMIDYIRHENELIHQRTTWFLGIQTVLGAAAGWVYVRRSESLIAWLNRFPAMPTSQLGQRLVMWVVICMLGIVSSATAQQSIDGALQAQDSIHILWKRSVDVQTLNALPDMMGGKGNYLADIGGGFALVLPGAMLKIWWMALLAPVLAMIGEATGLV